MKILLLVFTCVVCVACTSTAQTSNSSHEAKSATAKVTAAYGSSMYRVSFDFSGNKTVVMTKSTGSKVLDDRIMPYVGEYMNGFRSESMTLSVPCKSVETATPHGKMIVRVAIPQPPYPYQARARHEQGSGSVKASFDRSGNAVSAEMVQSTGSKILDGNTINYALKRWKSSGGENVTTTIPVTYRLR